MTRLIRRLTHDLVAFGHHLWGWGHCPYLSGIIGTLYA